MQPRAANAAGTQGIALALSLCVLALGLTIYLLWRPTSTIGPGNPPIIGGLVHPGIEQRIRGEVLLGELACGHCHAAEAARHQDLGRTAPDLSSAASRIDPRYLESFLADPHGCKPGTPMPDLMRDWPTDRRAAAAQALTHYLRSIDGAAFARQGPDRIAASRGRALFHGIGCVACHAPRDEHGVEIALVGSVPLGRLGLKYGTGGLQQFLLAPHDIRPSRRMPDFGLTPQEAHDLSNYLLLQTAAAETTPATAIDASLAARGQELFEQLQCASCHLQRPIPASLAVPPLGKLDVAEGCLSGSRGDWPYYALTADQITDIRAALDPMSTPLTDEQRIQVQVIGRNCLACHQRNGLGGVLPARNEFFTSLDAAIGEEGRLPPPLTGVGAKLQEQWLIDSVAHGESSRPYLQTRMPGFGRKLAVSLAELFERVDELPAVEFEPLPENRKAAEQIRNLGHELVGDQGMNCISCHSFAGEGNGTMTAIDLVESTGRRLRREWFHHFMLTPFRFRPGSFMPQFFVDGESVRPEIANGDPDKQLAAMWHYLAEGRNTRKPRGMRREPIELLVSDEAVMLRRSVQNTGKRGISVGYPLGVNITFDAETLAMNQIWWGRFLDAGGVFRGQGNGQARPLGRARVSLPKGPSFAELANEDAPWPEQSRRELGHRFLGYDLDAQQRPTFRYVTEDVTIADAAHELIPETSARPTLRRTFSFSSATDKILFLRAAAAKSIEPYGEDEVRAGDSLLLRPPANSYWIRSTAEHRELLVRVPVRNGKAELVIDYRWREDRK